MSQLAASARTATGSSARTNSSANRSPTHIVCWRKPSPRGSRPSTAAVRPERSPRRSLDAFETVSEQPEAKRLRRAALADALAPASLSHGPPGVGKRAMATAFAAELLGDSARVERGSHPDLYVLEPLGDPIRIDAGRRGWKRG